MASDRPNKTTARPVTSVRMDREVRDFLKAASTDAGESLSQFLVSAAVERVQRLERDSSDE